MGRLLLRAADGDEQAAEDFWALRAMFAEAQERSRDLARRQAWRMINRSYRPEEPTMTAPAPVDILATNQRIAFTHEGQHWHGTVTRHSIRPDGTPRLHVNVDPGNGGINSVAYRLGDHFRPTHEGETCPDCGLPDRGLPMYSRP